MESVQTNPPQIQKPGIGVLMLYAIGQLGWSLASFGVANMLVFFYMRPESGASQIGTFIPQGAVLGVFTLIGLVSAGGRFFDALIDPAIASMSDNFNSAFGKRRTFMAIAAIPFAISGYLVFRPLVHEESMLNFWWLVAMLAVYYVFFTAYTIPYTALISELGHDDKARMTISTLISVTWAIGFLIGNSTYALMGWLNGPAFQIEPLRDAFQVSVAIIQCIALICMAVPVLTLRETKYAIQTPSYLSLTESLKTVFANRNFRFFLLSDFLYWLSLTFIQLGAVYYVILLLKLPTDKAFIFSLIGFVSSFLLYYPIYLLAQKMGKKALILIGFCVFILLFALLAMIRSLPFDPMTILYGLGFLSAMPLAIFGILPNAIVGDEVIQGERSSGQKLSGMYFGVRTFIMKIGVSAANLIFPSLLLLGNSESNPQGVIMSAYVALAFCIIGLIAFMQYKEQKGETG